MRENNKISLVMTVLGVGVCNVFERLIYGANFTPLCWTFFSVDVLVHSCASRMRLKRNSFSIRRQKGNLRFSLFMTIAVQDKSKYTMKRCLS